MTHNPTPSVPEETPPGGPDLDAETPGALSGTRSPAGADSEAPGASETREAIRDRFEDLLASIWLHTNWTRVTEKLTTAQKDLFADAVDASRQRLHESDPQAPEPVQRWWRDDAAQPCGNTGRCGVHHPVGPGCWVNAFTSRFSAGTGTEAFRRHCVEVAEATYTNWALARREDLRDDRSVGERIADAVLAVRDAELDRLRALVADYENGITWFTTCTGCAALLDKLYAADMQREQAEAAVARVRELHRADGGRCSHCSHPGCYVGAPCPTVRALDGDDQQETGR